LKCRQATLLRWPSIGYCSARYLLLARTYSGVSLGSSSDWSGVGLLTKEKIQNEATKAFTRLSIPSAQESKNRCSRA
jgi:hypothetical protein